MRRLLERLFEFEDFCGRGVPQVQVEQHDVLLGFGESRGERGGYGRLAITDIRARDHDHWCVPAPRDLLA
jgi:hypothetical protein